MPHATITTDRMRCLRCNRSLATCFCGFVRSFDTRTRFVILMHMKEFKRQTTGTGRLTELALHNSEIIMGIDFSDAPRLNQLLSDPRWFPVILYPGPLSHNLSHGDTLPVPTGKQLLVLVIDGTWHWAKKMMRLSRNLHPLPRVSFDADELSRFVIKRQPARHCVSTIEAVHYLLAALQKQGLEDPLVHPRSLLDTLDSIVHFQQNRIPTDGAPRRRTLSK